MPKADACMGQAAQVAGMLGLWHRMACTQCLCPTGHAEPQPLAISKSTLLRAGSTDSSTAVQVVAMLDQAYFNAEEYQEGGWVDELKYEWELYAELQKLQKVKEDEDLKQVRSVPSAHNVHTMLTWHQGQHSPQCPLLGLAAVKVSCKVIVLRPLRCVCCEQLPTACNAALPWTASL